MTEYQVEEIVERAQSRLGALESARDDLRGVVGAAQSPDGRITAYVDGTGALVDLRLAESVCGMDARKLSTAVLTTAHEAARVAAVRRAAMMDELRDALR